MIKKSKLRAWRKPELKRLGEIRDVAGAQGTGNQAATTKT